MCNGYARKIQRSKGQGRRIWGFFADLFKAFDCIDHNVLITQLPWYRVTFKSPKLVFSLLSKWTEGVRRSKSYIRKSDIKCIISQGSVLGPLLLNIDLTDLTLECEDDSSTSYADDTTAYSYAQDISSVISELQRITKKVSDWYKNRTPDSYIFKYQNLISSKKCHFQTLPVKR